MRNSRCSTDRAGTAAGPYAIICCLLAALVVCAASPARAQPPAPPQPIGSFVADVRGAVARFGHNGGLASLRGLDATDLPALGLGASVDAHWYPLKWHAITFGLGVQALFAHGRHGASDVGPAVTTSLAAASPQISFNFGSARGWSYLSGGVGPGRLTIKTAALTVPPTEHVTIINYGAGARWFTTRHLAFTFDIRFYDLQHKPPSGSDPGSPHASMFVGSVGIGIK